MITNQSEFFFKLPDSEVCVKVKFNVRVWECWVEVDQDGRGENTWEFGGEYLSFEEAVEHCLVQAKNWA